MKTKILHNYDNYFGMKQKNALLPHVTGLTGAPVHSGSWFGLPDFGITEWLQGKQSTSPQQSVLGASSPNYSPAPAYSPAPTSSPTGGGGQSNGGQPSSSTGNNVNSAIDKAAGSQQDAAAAAAEAARQAAQRSYQARVSAAETAKSNAGATYNWLIDTLGSNKEQTLKSISANADTSVQGYQGQQADTQTKYDSARQEILSTYRDLNLQQQKILRGSGQAQSSTSVEAQLRLNNLMGKDLSNLSTQNADAMAVIGNAIAAVKSKAADLSTQVETSTQQQLDKAALDYKAQVDAINANEQLDANQRQDAYDAASAKLEADKASIESWAAGLKVQAATLTANNTNALDSFITSITDTSGNLTTSLTGAQQKLSGLVSDVGNTSLDQGAQTGAPAIAVAKTATSKDQLDQLLAAGQITQDQYNTQLAALQSAPQSSLLAAAPAAGGAAAPTTALPNRASVTAGAQTDPLLAAIFGRAQGAPTA